MYPGCILLIFISKISKMNRLYFAFPEIHTFSTLKKIYLNIVINVGYSSWNCEWWVSKSGSHFCLGIKLLLYRLNFFLHDEFLYNIFLLHSFYFSSIKSVFINLISALAIIYKKVSNSFYFCNHSKCKNELEIFYRVAIQNQFFELCFCLVL